MKFKRPVHLEFPTTYYTFKIKSRDSGEIVEYRVQDLPEDRFEDVLEMFKIQFLPDESLLSAKGVHKDPKSIKTFSDALMEIMKSNISIACFRNDGIDDLVAVNIFKVHSKDDPKEEIDYSDDKIKDVFDFLEHFAKLSDIYAKYNVDQYLAAYGLCINRSYRGMGIATEMLKARVPYMRSMGLSITGTVFTAIGSQIAAKKANYEEYFSMSYDEIKKMDPRFDFTGNSTGTKNCVVMALKADS